MKIYIVDLEAVETRYTGQWKEHLPELFSKEGFEVITISGPSDIPSATTPGAFLNFGGTNIYKADQVKQISEMFCNGLIEAGDHFLFADAWHPGIINLKYMSELLGVPITTHGIWHAGSYDPQDFLGRLIVNKNWVRNAEKSFFYAFDHNYFATEFHINIFTDGLGLVKEKFIEKNKIIRTGLPFEYMRGILDPYKNTKKRDLILFPHRIAPEKQVEIFRDLATHLPQYEFVVCQDKQMSKHEYHTLLSEAKIVFSANLQETLGISMYEGAVLDAFPLVPDRLSYTEMFYYNFKYPSEWTENMENYDHFRRHIAKKIIDIMSNYDRFIPTIQKLTVDLRENFFSAKNLISNFK